MIDLTIKTLDSQNHKFSVPDTFTILELKEFIATQVNVEVVQQRLIFCGRVLSNETKLADIGINGKVMHLVQKVPNLSTTASGSSSTMTNSTSRSGQNTGLGFRGLRIIDPTVSSNGIPPELMQARELPRVSTTENRGTCNRVSFALDMISRGNEILNSLEHLLPNSPQSSALNTEQYPEGPQQAEASSLSVPPEGVGAPESSLPESSVPQSQSDPDSVNVIHLDESTIVIAVNIPHLTDLPPALMRQVHNDMEANNLFPIHQNATETSAESEFSNVPVGGSTNQSSAEPSPTTLPSSAPPEHHLRNDATSENRSTGAFFYRRRIRELIEELNKLNERFRPFYNMYCQYIIDDPRFDTTQGEHGSLRAQSMFDGVSEVMHFISHIYHLISGLIVAFNRAPPRFIYARRSSQQSTVLRAANTVTTITTGAPPSTQQSTSTQTTTTSQSIPSIQTVRLGHGGGSETPRTTDSSLTANPPSQGLARERWDFTSHMDPFLPCNSHHFEPNIRPVVLDRRSTQGTDRSSSSATSGNSTAQATGQSSSITDAADGQIRDGVERLVDSLERAVDFNTILRNLNLPVPSISVPGFEHSMSASTSQSTPHPPNRLLTIPIGEIPYFRSLEGQSMLVDLFLIISRNWTLHDMLSVNLMSETSTLRTNPVTAHSEELINFILNRIMLNRPPSNQNIEDAANRIFLEILRYINIFQRIVPIHTNINVIASFRRCILQHLRGIINYCCENRMGAIDNIVHLLTMFAKGFLSLIAYCCNHFHIFRLYVSAVMHYSPLPSNLRSLIKPDLNANIVQYWERITTFQMMSSSLVDHIILFDESTQPLRASNNGEQSNPSMPTSENINKRFPEVVIGSQDRHHNASSVWAQAIARNSKRQRRQATQPPHSDAHSSGVPNKRRKIVTSSKPLGSLSQMIANNLEVAMGAAGVAINTEVITNAGADTAVQNAYTERIKTLSKSRLKIHPDFCPTRYPNASKFFSVHHRSN